MDQIIERNMDQMEPPAVGNSLFENRTAMAEMRQTSQPEVSILITAFNRLEKTRRCVESVLANTTGIHYELILLDNGSTDGTLEYFKSIPFQNKKIIHISKNLGAGNAILDFTIDDFGNYICSLANDIIVTPHWMENLLVCMKSDPRIGMVNPVDRKSVV